MTAEWVSAPSPTVDTLFAQWWEATTRREFLVQKCRQCAHCQHYPRALCTACGSEDVEFVRAAGTGRLYSYTEIHRAPRPGLPVPYVVCLVVLDEGPSVLSRLEGLPAGDGPQCDSRVRLGWHPLPDGRNLPIFTPSVAVQANAGSTT